MARANQARLVAVMAFLMICGMVISCIVSAGSLETSSVPSHAGATAQPVNASNRDAGPGRQLTPVSDARSGGRDAAPREPDQDGPDGGGACCKTCRRGKACGNSCISRNMVCRKGPGCACDE